MDKINESVLVDIRQVPVIYRSIFAAYPSFNLVQSRVFHDVFDSDHSVALCAPTGSGKTVIFELAIIRQLMAAEKSKYSNVFQIVYISPMKALCEERLIDWHKKFSPFGINCISVTGDSDYMDFHSLYNHNLIIITTPEKWDSITRRWKENKRLIQVIKLFMIDEIHLLNEENRGATLEVLVCRMKTIQSSLFDDTEENGSSRQNIRFLAVSATFPNIQDVGEWLGAKYYSFESSMRPVKLKTIVLGFNYNRNCTMFKFDISLNYKLSGLILKYSNGKPTLIFCSTRKSVEMAAKHLVQSLTIPLSDTQKEILLKAASSIADTKLKSAIVHGIGYHHGGLLPETRSVIEQLFRNGGLPVLVTTSTLATGVNLPAHLVIIKSTKFYDKGGFQDYSASALLQMLGRAGRPQFDTEATALILTSTGDMAKFEKMVDGKENIESNLHRHLTEHLNAEIVLRTITDLDVAMRWLSSTFLYIRARKNPRHYGIPLGLTADKIDKKLLEIFQIDLNKLVKAEMASMDEDVNISSTFLGTLMAKYYISFESMKLLKSMNGNEMLQQVLSLISKSKEFSDMRLRVDEKKCLNLLNKTKHENSIRFPFNGKIKTLDMKINCIIQAVFGCLEIEDQSILSEAFRVMRQGERICRCLIEYLESRGNCYSALLNSIVLWKCFRAELWENSKHVAKQFPGIGLVLAKQLVNAGKISFEKIMSTNPREIEMITRKKPPFGNKIVDLSKSIPMFDMKVEKCPSPTNLNLKISVTLLNPQFSEGSTFVNISSVMCLLIGNNLNHILLHERYMHSYMLENIEVVRFVELKANMHDLTEVYCNFVSEDLVGIDICETFYINGKPTSEQLPENLQPQVSKAKKIRGSSTPSMKKLDPKYSSFVQTYIDKYMKCKKSTNSTTPLKQPVVRNGNCFNAENLPISDKNPKILGENPAQQKQDIEITKIPKENSNRYSLSQFDETIIEKPENVNSEKLDQEKAHQLRSFTDEEMLESVEFLLDQNQDSKKHDMDISDDKQESRNVGTALQTDFFSSDLDKEFSKLYDKYGTKKEIPKENIEKKKQVLVKNNKQTITSLNISTKGKIHSVESFENSLFNPKTDSLSLFRYQPSKRLSLSSGRNDPPSAPVSKRKRMDTNEKSTEDLMENLEKFIGPNEKESLQYSKSIKWRSPLVYSPPVKYSPKISTSFSFSVPMPKNNDSENSHDWSLNTVETNNSSKTVATPNASKNQPRSRTQGTRFLLADKEYDRAEKPLNNTAQNIATMRTPQKSQQVQDFFSSSFLEDLGYSEKQKMTSNMRCFSQKTQDLNNSVQSAGAYYHDMVAKDAEEQRKESQKPFYLSQASQKPFHLIQALPANNLGVVSEADPRWSQPVGRKGFAPYQRQVEVLTPNMSRLAAAPSGRNFDNSWLETNPSRYYNIMPGDVARPEYPGRNVLGSNVDTQNFWNNSAKVDNHLVYNPQQMAEYPEDHDVFYRGPNHFHPSLANAMPNNNFPTGIEAQMEIPKRSQSFDPRCLQDAYPSELETRRIIDKENSNYHLNAKTGDVRFGNRQPLQSDTQGFFLNQPVPSQFYDGSQTTPLWNFHCVAHRIFNCYWCSEQNCPSQPNMNVQSGFNRNPSFTAANVAGPGLPNEYYNNPSFAPFSQQYLDRTRPDNSFMQRGGIPSPYVQSVNRTPQYESDLQNTFGGQNLGIQGGVAYQEFPRESTMRTNKTFMLSKFLNSFDGSLKNQE